MVLTDLDRLLRKIREAPEDVALRHVYADCLEDADDPRADFVRQSLAFDLLEPCGKCDEHVINEGCPHFLEGWRLYDRAADNPALLGIPAPRLLSSYRHNSPQFSLLWDLMYAIPNPDVGSSLAILHRHCNVRFTVRGGMIDTVEAPLPALLYARPVRDLLATYPVTQVVPGDRRPLPYGNMDLKTSWVLCDGWDLTGFLLYQAPRFLHPYMASPVAGWESGGAVHLHYDTAEEAMRVLGDAVLACVRAEHAAGGG